MPTDPKRSRIPTSEVISYGVTDFGFNLLSNFYALYILVFWTTVAGIRPALAGTLLLVSRLLDAASDPLVGLLAQQTRTRRGQLRPWLLWGAAPLALATGLLFTSIEGSEVLRATWALGGSVLLGMAFTATAVPYGALTSVMTPDYDERSRLTAWRMSSALLAGLVIAVLAPRFLEGLDSSPFGFSLLAWLIGGVCAVLVSLCAVQVVERIPSKPLVLPWRQGLRVVLANRPFCVLASLGALQLTLSSLFLALVPYYFAHGGGGTSLQASACGLFFLCSGLSVPVWSAITKRRGKRAVALASLAVQAGSLALLAAARPGGPLVVLAYILAGAAGGGLALSLWSMLPDTIDAGVELTGLRTPGLMYGAWGFCLKVGGGAGGLLAGVGLSLLPFDPASPESLELAAGIASVQCIAGLCLTLLSTCALSRYKLDRAAHAALVQRLAEPEAP